jgi:hypothetical protein
MSPTSNLIESMAARHGVPATEATEYFLERKESRHGDESAALADLEVWCKLWAALKPAPSLGIPKPTRGVR